MAITIMGLSVTRFPQSANPDLKRAEMDVLYSHSNVDAPKIHRIASGRTSKEPFGKDPLKLNADYAELLINSRAFVSGEEYNIQMSFNDEEMESEITALVPVDSEVKKYFESSISNYERTLKS